MKKVHALAAMALPAGIAAVMTPAAAHATTAGASADHGAARSGKAVALGSHFKPAPRGLAGFFVSAIIIRGPAPLWSPGNRIIFRAPDYTDVRVTCYYSGNTGFASDPYWDHFTAFSSPSGYESGRTGHVADHYVSLEGRYPASAGIPHC